MREEGWDIVIVINDVLFLFHILITDRSRSRHLRRAGKKTTDKHQKDMHKEGLCLRTYRNNESRCFIGWFQIQLGDLRERSSHFPVPAFSAAGFMEDGRVSGLQQLEQLGLG